MTKNPYIYRGIKIFGNGMPWIHPLNINNSYMVIGDLQKKVRKKQQNNKTTKNTKSRKYVCLVEARQKSEVRDHMKERVRNHIMLGKR